MADWDSLIAETEASSTAIKPVVHETGLTVNRDFAFGDAAQEFLDDKLKDAMNKAIADPTKMPAIDKKKKKDESAGKDWFNIPKSKLTEEDKRDWQILHMRSVIEKGAGNVVQLPEEPPEFLQFGTIQTHAMDGKKARLTRKERGATILESLAKDDTYINYLNEEKAKKLKPK